MGYTTEFTGAFSCYHPENETIGAFLKAIREGDRAAVAALGDWLLDRGDPRGEAVARVATEGGALGSLSPHFGLRPEHAAYLRAFNQTRRMKRDPEKAKHLPDPVREAAGLPVGPDGGYFVGGGVFLGYETDDSVLSYGNQPPDGQPSLICQWTVNEDGTAIEWDGCEKFYCYVEWLEYLVAHFLGPWGYLLNGEVAWQGEDESDTGRIVVVENAIHATPSMQG